MKRLTTALIAIAVMVGGFALFAKPAEAALVPLTGYAWSDVPQDPGEGAGWIKFSGTAINGSPYGVFMETTNGNLSGYAWSETFGWLSFNQADTTGCPTAPCEAKVIPGNGSLSGWARFTAAPVGTADEWNGWVHLGGANYGGVGTYNTTTGNFSGYAWGENYVGWIKWSGTDYGVSTGPVSLGNATIVVDITPNTGTWTINPGNIQRTGDNSISVTPDAGGTTYTLTEGAPPTGYGANPSITISQLPPTCTSPCRSISLFGGDTANYTVTYSQALDYTLSNGGNINIVRGGGSHVEPGQTAITKTLSPSSGPTQAVDLSVSGLPSGVSYNFSDPTCSPTCTSTFNIGVSSSAPLGTYPLTVTGTPGGKTTNFNLIITGSALPFVTCLANPTSGQVGQVITWTANVSQTPSKAPYTYEWSGDNIPTDPAPDTQSFPITYTTTGTKKANVSVRDSIGNTVFCDPEGSVNIGVRPIFEEF